MKHKIILLTLFVFSSFLTLAQEGNKLTMKFMVRNDTALPDQSMALYDYVITINKDKKKEEKVPIKREKGLKLDLELNCNYTFTFSKPGYITKSIRIDTHIPDKREKDKFEKFTTIVRLEKQPVEFFIVNSKAVGKINYDADIKDFDYNKDSVIAPIDIELEKKRDKVFNKGWWQMGKGNYKEAKEIFTGLISKNPQDIAALYNRGKAEFKMNDKTAACADWNTIKTLGKDYADKLIQAYCDKK